MSRHPDHFMARRKSRVWLEILPRDQDHTATGWTIYVAGLYHVIIARSTLSTLVARATACFGPHSRAPRMLKRTRVFLRIPITCYLWLFVTKNKALSPFRRVPESAICKSFLRESEKHKKHVWYRHAVPIARLSSTKSAVASSLKLYSLASRLSILFFFQYSLLDHWPLTALPVQIFIPASVFNCLSALFGKQHFSCISISRHQKRREVWPGWQWGLLPSLTPGSTLEPKPNIACVSVNLFKSTPYPLPCTPCSHSLIPHTRRAHSSISSTDSILTSTI